MSPRKRHLPAALLALILIVGPWCRVLAQEQDHDGAGIQIRVLCSQPVTGAAELKLVQDNAILHEIGLAPAMVSDAIAVGRGELLLARQGADAGELDPLLRVAIPEAGRRFVLALFPAPDSELETPYQHMLIRTDGLRFGASDLYLFNLTGTAVGGTLGTRSFTVEPGGSEVVTPVPASRGERMYQARLYHMTEGGQRLFSDTRWPLAASSRVYLFFIADPRRRSISYVSFREYAPFD